MASTTPTAGLRRRVVGTWYAGVGAGIAGVLPMIVSDAVVFGNELFLAFGLFPFAVLWGLVYAGVASIDRIGRLAATPRTGVPLGVAYSALVWMGPQVGEPIGQGTFTVAGAVQVVLFGAVLGLVHAYSPDVGVE